MQAKAAIQAGLRKANARERSAIKLNHDGSDNRRREQTTNSSDSSRYICLLRFFWHVL